MVALATTAVVEVVPVGAGKCLLNRVCPDSHRGPWASCLLGYTMPLEPQVTVGSASCVLERDMLWEP